MADYTLEKTGTLNIDFAIKNAQNPKDLFNLECIDDSDNISLLKAQTKLLYHTIVELESRIKNLEGKK